MGYHALYLLRRNIEALLTARKESQTTLAFALGHDKSWLNKFLNGTREIQFKDLDRIADFFGIATYQLFQPGISPLTERRISERRGGRDRRIGQAQRHMLEVKGELDRVRAPETSHGEMERRASALPEALRSKIAQLARLVDDLVDRPAHAGRQTPPTGPRKPPTRPRRRADRGPVPTKAGE